MLPRWPGAQRSRSLVRSISVVPNSDFGPSTPSETCGLKARRRRFSGHGVPGENYEVAAGGARASVASLDGSLRVERWAGRYARSWRARIETAPLMGFSLFASYEDGETGAPFVSEYEAYLRSLRLGPPLQPDPIEKTASTLHEPHGNASRRQALLARPESLRSLAVDGGGFAPPPRARSRSRRDLFAWR